MAAERRALSLPMNLRRLSRPLPVLLLSALGLSALLAADLLHHDGKPSFPGAWPALILWPLAAAATSWLAWNGRRVWRQLLLAAVASLLGVGVLELVLPRLFPERGLPQLRGVRSHWLHHALPLRTTMFAGLYDPAGQPVLVRTNADGLRSTYDRESFLAHQQRIAILGDSFVFGWGVPIEAAWPSRLEATLRQASPDLAVLDAGVFSYSPLLTTRQWQRIVRTYRPQLVLEVLDATDIGDDWKYASEQVAAGPDQPFPWPDQSTLAWHGAVYKLLGPLRDALRSAVLYPARIVRHVAAPANDYYDFRLSIDGTIETNRFFIYRHPLAVTRPYFVTTWRHVESLAAAVRADGAEFAVVILPRFQHWNPKECPDNWEHDEYSRHEPFQDEMFRFYDEVAATADFPVFDLLPAFRATTEFPLVFDRDPHFNAAGNAFVAEAVQARLGPLLARLPAVTPPPAAAVDATEPSHLPNDLAEVAFEPCRDHQLRPEGRLHRAVGERMSSRQRRKVAVAARSVA